METEWETNRKRNTYGQGGVHAVKAEIMIRTTTERRKEDQNEFISLKYENRYVYHHDDRKKKRIR